MKNLQISGSLPGQTGQEDPKRKPTDLGLPGKTADKWK